MSERRSLRLPITLGILMIVLLIALTVGWIVLATFGLQEDQKRAALYVALLSIGTTFFVLVLVGTVMYLLLSIKAINLTRRQSNFIDSVTHELKSPIASLKLYLQTLTRRPVEAEEQAEFLNIMLDDVERLDLLINHILDAARLDKNVIEPADEVIDLAALLAETAQIVCLRYRIPRETIRLDLQPLSTFARRVDLEMIFRNLIDNAVKYSEKHAPVFVSLSRTNGDRALIRIRDHGPGIPKKLRRKIFGRFVRLGSELERQEPGTGLGLFIVRTLVRRQKGTIRVCDPPPPSSAADQHDHHKSTVAGEGTVFEVELPLHLDTIPAAVASLTGHQQDPSPKRDEDSARHESSKAHTTR